MEIQAILAAASPGPGGRITLIIKRQCKFPAKFADVYAQTWDRIINQPLGQTLLAMNIFTWVLYANRSFSIEELPDAVASCPDSHPLDSGQLVAAEILVSVCCGLITKEEDTRQFRLVRFKPSSFNLSTVPLPAAGMGNQRTTP
ncbi:hypothetical protein BKA70DRAFT_1315470 [Coprinopsis sp. MPI-PUGE-AT-0042]|nr:hypothetical protein BKA70DRAFT_1315470 [Coprinopsis sp. MPI-PUGE-AT-0042]